MKNFYFLEKKKKELITNKLKKFLKILKFLVGEPVYEKENIIGLKRNKQQITTEPGLQYELSGAPLKNIHLVCSESSTHFNEIKVASKDLDIAQHQ